MEYHEEESIICGNFKITPYTKKYYDPKVFQQLYNDAADYDARFCDYEKVVERWIDYMTKSHIEYQRLFTAVPSAQEAKRWASEQFEKLTNRGMDFHRMKPTELLELMEK